MAPSYFGAVILGGADEHGEIYRCLDVVDLPGVLLGLLQNLSRLMAATTAQLGLSNTFLKKLERLGQSLYFMAHAGVKPLH